MYEMSDVILAGQAYSEAVRLIKRELNATRKLMKELPLETSSQIALRGRIEGLNLALGCIKQAKNG